MSKVFSYSLVILFVFSVEAGAQQLQIPETAPPVPYSVESSASGLAPVSYLIHTRPKAPGKRVKNVSDPMTVPAEPLDGLTPEQLAIVEKLNRVDAPRLKRLQTVVVPSTWHDNELAYSPFPQEYPWASDKPKALVVDQVAQAFAAYEYGRLVRWGPVSTGDSGQTPSGLFSLSWRSRGHASSIDPSWYLEWYFNFIPSRGIAFHQYSLPGRAASHGCVRMLERDAQWLFEWGEAPRKDTKGTQVAVLGCPDPTKLWHQADFLRDGIALPAVPAASTLECNGYSGAAATSQRKTIR